jgi:hypothetical protein
MLTTATHMNSPSRTLLALVFSVALCGCESFGRGVAEAVLEPGRGSPAERLCDASGPGFAGLDDHFAGASPAAPKTVRLLVVHGMGPQEGGYSEFFVRRVADRLGLRSTDTDSKRITLWAADGDGEIGNLRLNRFFDNQGRRLIVFETMWTPTTEEERKLVSFDDFGAAANQRASINKTLKRFINTRLVDPLAYMGSVGAKMQESVAQAFCWMSQAEWDGYAPNSAAVCEWADADLDVIREDGFAIAGHSLGTRIALDTLTALAATDVRPETSGAHAAFRDKGVALYMLSNQLPLLQAGRTAPNVTGDAARYCQPAGPLERSRWLNRLDVVAFSDPNDLLSYPIPLEFAERFIDSRLCPQVTNVTVKVTDEISLAGLTTFANPEDAHIGYEADDRVISMITQGLGDSGPPQGCTWLKAEMPPRP